MIYWKKNGGRTHDCAASSQIWTDGDRAFGRRVRRVGFGGIVVRGMAQRDADHIVAEAIERGVNYFDVAPTYGDAEERLGPALKPYRRDVFLACKTIERTREGAASGLESSLKRLCTDHLDLYQLHGLGYRADDDVDAIFAKGGAFEVFLEAKREGKVRHLGFSAHTEKAALRAMDRYDFDSVMFPFNFVCWYRSGFGRRVLNRAGERGTACLALKALARERWPESDPQRETYSKCWYKPITDRRALRRSAPVRRRCCGWRWTLANGLLRLAHRKKTN